MRILRRATLARRRPADQPQEWEQWLVVTRKAIALQAITQSGPSPPEDRGTRLIHTSCRRRVAAASHCRKSKHWVVTRYFGQFHPTRRDRWVFGNRDSGAYLLRFGWTKIIRHDLVKGASSPDDPTLSEYWARRRRKAGPEPPLERNRMF